MYNKSNQTVILPNGSRIKGFSAEEPDRLRGPQHHGGWLDELAAWPRAETYDQYKFGLRLGQHPKTVITTTPRPTKIIKELIADESTFVTRGSTFDNRLNLAPAALAEFERKYAGTRLGQQELFGAILDDNPGALWTRALIDDARKTTEELPSFTRVVVGVDPAVTSGEDSDSTGIVTAAMDAQGHYYVLSDDTLKASPQEWATKAVQVFERYRADRIVAETNNGGDLVVHLFQQVKATIPVRKVTASRGKTVRAEPIAALYEQGRVHHVGYFSEMEDQMCEFEPGLNMKSPDRMDALVWALTELSEGSSTINFLNALANFCPKCHTPVNKSATFCPKCNSAIGA
jgi:phage terminase large subunit-like protein